MSRSKVVPLTAVLVFAVAPPGAGAAGPEAVLELSPSSGFELTEPFTGFRRHSPTPVFDAVAADMDLDGDPDLFVNRHHALHPELFRNVGGAFELVNPRGADRSGLYDNPGVPELEVYSEAHLRRIRRRGKTGLYLWYDRSWQHRWMVFWKPPRPRRRGGAVADTGSLTVRLRFNTPITETSVPGGVTVERPDRRTVRFSLERSRELLAWFEAAEAGAGLTVETAGDDPAAIYVGADFVRFDAGSVELWQRDPHGIAWVQVVDSPEPDLFLSRGALRGTLSPPEPPKTNLFYVWQGDVGALYRRAGEGVVPPDYGRGRQVEWVDIDRDGLLELYAGNEATPNVFLFQDPATGRLQDRASELGLALLCGETFAWWDWDGDGLEDYTFLCRQRLALGRNTGKGFDVLDGGDLGLDLPGAVGGRSGRVGLHLYDFDSDGRLDLWLTSYGEELENRLFLRRGEGFVDITAGVGLDRVKGTRLLVVLDADNDGFNDALSVGDELLLLRNTGRRLEIRRLDTAATTEEIRAASAVDTDGDGGTDLVLIGQKRYLARNLLHGGRRHFTVRLLPDPETGSEAVGARVTLRYSNGRRQVQRYGSSANTGFSQSLLPLRFGVPPGERVEAVAVRWPGTTRDAVYGVPPGAGSIVLTGRTLLK